MPPLNHQGFDHLATTQLSTPLAISDTSTAQDTLVLQVAAQERLAKAMPVGRWVRIARTLSRGAGFAPLAGRWLEALRATAVLLRYGKALPAALIEGMASYGFSAEHLRLLAAFLSQKARSYGGWRA